MNAVSATTTQTSGSRYHSFDALRAVAMLGGILLHALWMYCPIDARAPVVDSSAHHVPYYLFFTIHIFRMHAFFLIAGFFAHLVYTRRSARAFLIQRIQRIGLPLAIGWFALYPMVHWCKAWGSSVSGAEITGLTTSEVFLNLFSSWNAFSSTFSFMHLWFLHLLLQFCVLTIIGVQTLKSVNIPNNWRAQGRQTFVAFIESR